MPRPNEPMKHHYVPQSILRRFSIGGKRQSIFVFDKAEQRSFQSHIKDAGAERNFYRVNIDGRSINLETSFQDIDDQFAELVNKVVKASSIAVLSASERYNLAVVTACQLLRTKLQRTSPIEISKQLTQRLQDLGMEAPTELTDSASRLISIRRLLELEPIVDLLASKDLLLLSSHQAKLWTSDNPVVIHNTFPYGQCGLASPGVEIYHPLSDHLCLEFLCPSIQEMIAESLDPLHPRPASKDPRMHQTLKCLQNGTPLEVDSNCQLFLNSLQVGQSSRFLFGSEDDFDLARRAISKYPDLQEVRSLTTVGSVGSMTPSPNMPMGTWLVIESGHRHHILAVELLEDEGSGTIDFTTADLAKLAMVELNSPFDCVTLFKDRHQIHMIREVIFCHVERAGHRFVRVQHTDANMNALMEQINRKHQ